MTTGRLYGVGARPRRPRAGHGQGRPADRRRRRGRLPLRPGTAARIARAHRRAVPARRQIEEALVYPVTTETTDHPGGYQGAIDEFYDAAAERLAAHLDAGRDVVVLAEGDPFFYGSYMHMHKRLAHRYPTEVVPGVTSSAPRRPPLGRPLVERDEVLTVLPGTLPPRRAGRAARRHRLRGRHEARPHVRHRPRGRRPTPAASTRLLRRARHDRRAAHRRARRRRPRLGALLLARPAAEPRSHASPRRAAGTGARGRARWSVVGTGPGRAATG